MYKPTNSHNSTPSKLPVVTSKSRFLILFIHISMLSNGRDFFECIMVLISSSLIFTKVFAYVIAFSDSSLKIHFLLFFMFLNQFITVLVSCHLFSDDKSLTLLISFSRNYLLIFSISFFPGLFKRHSGFELNYD